MNHELENTNHYPIFGEYFKKAALFIVLAEILSLFGYLLPQLNTLLFFSIVVITLILSFKKLEYGLYILLAELFIGSKGYLFYFGQGGTVVSVRIGIFLAIFSAFIFSLLKNRDCYKKIFNENRRIFMIYGLLMITVLAGLLNGRLRGNEMSNIFFDFNNWLYFLLLPVFFTVISSQEKIFNIINIWLASITTVTIKVLTILFISSHDVLGILTTVYKWVRNSGVGEITPMGGGLYRIFFQAQIYSLLGFFVILFLLIYYTQQDKSWFGIGRQHETDKAGNYNWQGGVLFVLLSLASVNTIISLSRSFWLGLIAGFLIVFILLVVIFKLSFLKLFKTGISVFASFALGITLLSFVIYFPLGRRVGGNALDLLGDRALAFSGEAAVSSRWLLLNPLWQGIKKNPLLGSGFGSTITYKSQDPRILASHPTGDYETYAFEWGYLDVWLKLGIIGLLVYLCLLGKILWNGWKIIKTQKDYLVCGLATGLIVLIVTHIFSPYLNHPLGIGYVMLCTVIISHFAHPEHSL